jgi:cell division inhibitor SulA
MPAPIPTAAAIGVATDPATRPISTALLRERLAQLERGGGSSGSGNHRNGGGAGSQTGGLSSGYAALDARLPQAGWPRGALTELLSDTSGIGELQLLMPALVQLVHAGRCIVWIAPPYRPYAPALVQQGLAPERLLMIHTVRPQQSLWATEQALRCPAVGAVLSWAVHIVDRSLRRLQLAAEAGGSLGILHRPAAAVDEPSPAALRLRLHAATDGLVLQIRKARGGRAGTQLHFRAAPAHSGRSRSPTDPDVVVVPAIAGAAA